MTKSIKIVIPMAGFGSRMRPHTWSKPKPLVPLAGRTVLDYVLDQFSTMPKEFEIEYIFILGTSGGQIKDFMDKNYPDLTVHYVYQLEMRGQSHALYLAKEYLTGPTLMAFSDTLIETDLSFLKEETCDGVAWVKEVPDPRRFGVAITNEKGKITRLIEKPDSFDNRLVVVGFYYFKSGEQLVTCIQDQMDHNIQLKNEYFLADAVNIMIDKGADLRTERVETWLDAGIPSTTLETNAYLLNHGHDNSRTASARKSVTIIPPVFIDETAEINNCVLGPHVSIGKGCKLDHVILENSIVANETTIENKILEGSLIGEHAVVNGHSENLNVGDHCKLG